MTARSEPVRWQYPDAGALEIVRYEKNPKLAQSNFGLSGLGKLK